MPPLSGPGASADSAIKFKEGNHLTAMAIRHTVAKRLMLEVREAGGGDLRNTGGNKFEVSPAENTSEPTAGCCDRIGFCLRFGLLRSQSCRQVDKQ